MPFKDFLQESDCSDEDKGTFNIFKIIRRKNKSIDALRLEAEPKPIPLKGYQEKYTRIWNDSPVVNPLSNPPLPREERIPPNMTRRLNIFVQIPPHVAMKRLSQADALTKIASIGQVPESRSSTASTAVEPSEEAVMELRHRRLLEEMVNNCAREPRDRKEWGYWFKAYTDGRFNISNPPQTPPRDPNLDWIPTPFPALEADRLKAFELYDLSNIDHIEGDLRTVLRNATTALGAEFAAVSLINYESEIFLLNHPIRIDLEAKLKRACSLGAHVMIGHDTMVILDTEKDWRFRGNPWLGSGSSRVSFYAGSPLLSPDGFNIGVLSISSRVPRTMFTKNDHRSLNNFASVISTHLERLLPENNIAYSSGQSENTPQPAPDHTKPIAALPSQPEVFRPRNESRIVAKEPKPQCSIPRPRQRRLKRIEARLEAERKLTEMSIARNQSSSSKGGLSPTAPPVSFLKLLPTPVRGSFSQEIFPPQTPKLPPSPKTPKTPVSPRHLLDLDTSRFSNPQKLKEARELISNVAKEIDFDYLYIVRLEPTNPRMTYMDLLSPSQFQIVMMHSYRRNPSPSGSANQALNTELHLRGLWDRFGLTAVHSRESNQRITASTKDDFYQISVLLPIQRDFSNEEGAITSCIASSTGQVGDGDRVCRGHILGAYKRRNTGDFRKAIERLGEVANELGVLMFHGN